MDVFLVNNHAVDDDDTHSHTREGSGLVDWVGGEGHSPFPRKSSTSRPDAAVVVMMFVVVTAHPLTMNFDECIFY